MPCQCSLKFTLHHRWRIPAWRQMPLHQHYSAHTGGSPWSTSPKTTVHREDLPARAQEVDSPYRRTRRALPMRNPGGECNRCNRVRCIVTSNRAGTALHGSGSIPATGDTWRQRPLLPSSVTLCVLQEWQLPASREKKPNRYAYRIDR